MNGLQVEAIEWRPWFRGEMHDWEAEEWELVSAGGDFVLMGNWLFDHGFEFRLDLGTHFAHVTPEC